MHLLYSIPVKMDDCLLLKTGLLWNSMNFNKDRYMGHIILVLRNGRVAMLVILKQAINIIIIENE